MFSAIKRNWSKTFGRSISTGLSPDQIKFLKKKLPHFPSEAGHPHPFVDKSEIYLELLSSENLTYLLHRPYVFGKTTTASMLAHFYLDPMSYDDLKLGKKLKSQEKTWNRLQERQKSRTLTRAEEDFMKIYKPLRLRNPHPVLYFDNYHLSGDGISTEMLEDLFHKHCKEYADLFSLNYTSSDLTLSFRTLLNEIKSKTGLAPAIIIDYYDRDIRYKENPLKCRHYKKYMTVWKKFFSGFRDAQIQFGFLIGNGMEKDMVIGAVGKSIIDISAEEKYGEIMGFTMEEIKENFDDEIKKAMESKKMSEAKLLQKLTDFYGGYTFSPAAKPVFCPFSIKKSLNHHDFEWFSMRDCEMDYVGKVLKRFPSLVFQSKHALVWQSANAYKKRSFQYALKTLWSYGYFSPKWDPETLQLRLSFSNAMLAGNFRCWLVKTLVPEKYRITHDYRESEEPSIPLIVTFLNHALRAVCSVSKEEFSYGNVILTFLYGSGTISNMKKVSPDNNEIIASFYGLHLIVELEICKTRTDKVRESAERGMKRLKEKGLQNRFLGLEDKSKVYLLALSIDPNVRRINEFLYSQVGEHGEEVVGEGKFNDLREEIARRNEEKRSYESGEEDG